ncbi:MAG: DUF192 domain-containing protein [Paracoccus sp. (in: a-proteobacteria)]
MIGRAACRAGMKLALSGLVVLGLGLGLGLATAQAAPSCHPDQAVFPDAGVTVQVEIADDPAERAQGLMNRDRLAPGTGMLFIYDSPREVAFWMKDTLIPLDMVFMDASGTIRHIHPSARPLDETAIPGAKIGDPAPERLMILEIGGGESARLGLKEGMAMAYPRLDPALAAAACR